MKSQKTLTEEFKKGSEGEVEREQFHHYLRWLIGHDVFSDCENKTVLEMGPHMGDISNVIQRYSPKRHLLVEPNPDMKDYLKDHELFTGTYNQYIEQHKEKFDVVVSCGVIYHLHSPLDMIEKVITINQPETFILETKVVNAPEVWNEPLNTWGHAYNTEIPYVIMLPLSYYKDVMMTLGYSLKKEICWNDLDVVHWMKRNMQMMVFKKD